MRWNRPKPPQPGQSGKTDGERQGGSYALGGQLEELTREVEQLRQAKVDAILSEEKFRESEARFRAIFEQAAAGISQIDPSGRFVLVNQKLCEMTGYVCEELYHKTFYDITHPEDVEADRAQFQRVLTGGADRYTTEKRYVRKDGAVAWVMLHRSVVRDSAGRVRYAIAVSEDITERKRAEQALADSEQRLREHTRVLGELARSRISQRGNLSSALKTLTMTAAESLGLERCSVWLFNQEMSEIRCIDLYERSKGEHSHGQTLNAADFPSYFRALTEQRTIAAHDALTDPRTSEFADPYLRPLNIGAMLDAPIHVHGRLAGVLCHEHVGEPRRWMIEDEHLAASLADFVSLALESWERSKAEEALRDSEQRLKLALEAGHMGAWAWDFETHQVTWSPSLERIHGLEPGTFSGIFEHALQPIHGEDRPRVLESLRRCANDRQPYQIEYRIVRPGGEGGVAWVEARGNVIVDEHNKPVRMAGICADITQRKLTEQELQRHRQHLEALVLERTAQLESSHARLRVAERLASLGTLAAGIGHDMGNLLLPIRSRIDAIKAESAGAGATLSPSLMEHIRAIQQSASYLQALTNGLRLLALDPDDPEASGSITNLTQWWPDVQSLLRSALPRSVALQPQLPGDLPPLRIAPHRLTQVVLNLVNNASDALRDRTSGGEVTIAAEAGPNPNTVQLLVKDNGPGMPMEVRQRAFEPFFTTKSRSISTGLGLSLVHGIIQSVQGTVEIESEPGAGSTIILTIPAADELESGDGGAGGGGQAAVTVADKRTGMFINALLEMMGMRIEHAQPSAQDNCTLWITDATACSPQLARSFLAGSSRRSIIALGQDKELERLGITMVPLETPPSRIREVIQQTFKRLNV